ncbi:MAG: hypothetical protein MI861_00770, partial [Pirellulales bacterium]|nr:hypothetical protein [Pirellulales bacterium]
MSSTECPFRLPIADNEGVTAVCDFVRRLTGASDQACLVDASACEICSQQAPLASPDVNPVVASLIYQATEQFNGEAGTQGLLLRDWARSAIKLDSALHFGPATFACDVVLRCRGDEPELERCVAGILEQKDVFVLL